MHFRLLLRKFDLMQCVDREQLLSRRYLRVRLLGCLPERDGAVPRVNSHQAMARLLYLFE